MKKLCIVLLLLSTNLIVSNGQEFVFFDKEKVESIDNIITTLYDVISGEKGEERDWDLMRGLFHPEAKLIPSGVNNKGVHSALYLTVEEYISTSGKWLVDTGFFETEIHREVDRFGNLAQVFSTYESFRSKSDTEPFMRGINSIQLLFDGERWWIINIYWMQESDSNPIPKKYLPN